MGTSLGRLIKWGFFGSMGALALSALIVSYRADQAQRADLARIKSLGMPLDKAAAEAQQAATASSSPLLERAVEARASISSTDEIIADYLNGTGRAPEAKHLGRLRELAYSLAQAKAIPMSKLVLVDTDALEELGTMKAMMRLLCGDARERIDAGDAAGAIRSMRAANRLSALLSNNEGLVPGYVSVVGQAFLWKVGHHYIEKFAKDVKALEQYRSYLSTAEPQAPLAKWLKCQFAADREMLRTASVPVGTNAAFAEKSRVWCLNSAPNRRAAERRLASYWRAAYDVNPGDGKENEWYRRMASIDSSLESDAGMSAELLRLFHRGITQETATYLRCTARRRVLLATTDLLICYGAHKTLPTALPAGSDFVDPLDDKPLRYSRRSTTFKVYSIGDDRVDNGGSYRGLTGPDIVFEMKLP